MIAFSKISQGSYFGEIEILRKTYRYISYLIPRDSGACAKTDCSLLTMKKKILLEDVSLHHVEFLNILVENMIKRYNFHEKVKNLINQIIEEGKTLISLIKNKPDNMNYNKYFFNLGLLKKMEQASPDMNKNALKQLLDASLMTSNIKKVDNSNSTNVNNNSNLNHYVSVKRSEFRKKSIHVYIIYNL